MTDSPSNPGQADEKSPVGSVHSASRRRWLQAGIAAAPVAMTVASRPVLATTNPPGICQAPSGFISSATTSGPAGVQCAGQMPSYWLNLNKISWPAGRKPDDHFKDVFTPDLPHHDYKLSEVLDPQKSGSGSPYDVARYIVAAMLNNAALRVPETTLSLATIKAMWTEYNNGGGAFSVNTSVSWSGSQIVAYLTSTMD